MSNIKNMTADNINPKPGLSAVTIDLARAVEQLQKALQAKDNQHLENIKLLSKAHQQRADLTQELYARFIWSMYNLYYQISCNHIKGLALHYITATKRHGNSALNRTGSHCNGN